MDRNVTRSIIEDLLPLYSEGLLREETVRWLEQQARDNPEYQQLLEQGSMWLMGSLSFLDCVFVGLLI
jgi:hypothetical protein